MRKLYVIESYTSGKYYGGILTQDDIREVDHTPAVAETMFYAEKLLEKAKDRGFVDVRIREVDISPQNLSKEGS